ncbi:SDR family oxidoreductase [Microbacterium sp.]|uniref:SDR family NAD(P)-dependent oxidoreductase n=1 Tax=Microbacterium sp. TaxID=51671 RepID=UPI00281227FF|nr:SDR family oxidoreductase [Microbacterium sp.]
MTTYPDQKLSTESTIGSWARHPTGSRILEAFAQRAGMDSATLNTLRNLPLSRMLAATGAPDADGVAGGLVAQLGDAGTEVPERDARQALTVPGRFGGRTVVVTGAASGIGRAVASRVALEGGVVVAVDLSEERLVQLSNEMPEGAIRPVNADITDAAAVARIIEATEGRVDGLANVAGLADDFSAIHEVSDEMLERVFAVNVFGLVRLTRAVVPLMLEAGEGSIVNVASEAAFRGSSAGLAYTASKHAVVGVTRSMAFMYEPSGIRVNTVAPGGTLTGMRPSIASGLGPERVRSFAVPVPIALPEHLAASITFLLSDDGVNVSGALLASDGGESAF